MREVYPAAYGSLNAQEWCSAVRGECLSMQRTVSVLRCHAMCCTLTNCIGGMHNLAPQMKFPDEIREFFRRQGSRGGKKRNRNLSMEKRREIARKAAQARWNKKQKQDRGTGGNR